MTEIFDRRPLQTRFPEPRSGICWESLIADQTNTEIRTVAGATDRETADFWTLETVGSPTARPASVPSDASWSHPQRRTGDEQNRRSAVVDSPLRRLRGANGANTPVGG